MEKANVTPAFRMGLTVEKPLTRCHKRFLYKLKYYGIRGQLESWIKSFLSDRPQIVVLNGVKPSKVKGKVPLFTDD